MTLCVCIGPLVRNIVAADQSPHANRSAVLTDRKQVVHKSRLVLHDVLWTCECVSRPARSLCWYACTPCTTVALLASVNNSLKIPILYSAERSIYERWKRAICHLSWSVPHAPDLIFGGGPPTGTQGRIQKLLMETGEDYQDIGRIPERDHSRTGVQAWVKPEVGGGQSPQNPNT